MFYSIFTHKLNAMLTFSYIIFTYCTKKRQRMWYLSENMGIFYPSTSLDFLDKKPIEFEYLFMKPLHIAKELNVSTPFLEEVVCKIDRIRVH